MDSESMSEDDPEVPYTFKKVTGFAINEELKERACFREHIVVGRFIADDEYAPETLGDMTIDIQSAQDDKFVIYLTTEFTIEGLGNCGSCMTSWLDNDLHTLEEKRMEFLDGDEYQYQTLYLAAQCGKMICQHDCSMSDERRVWELPTPEIARLSCEGAAMVIMRLLGLTKYQGSFEFTTLYINGDMCKNIYKTKGPEYGVVNDVKLELSRCHRIIIEKCGLVHECQTMVICESGRIIGQEWRNTVYVMHASPLIDLSTLPNKPDPDDQDYLLQMTWAEDEELESEYLDTKYLCEMRAASFYEDNEELADILHDYVNSILLHKPFYAFDFTVEYFHRYAPPPKEEPPPPSRDDDDDDDGNFY